MLERQSPTVSSDGSRIVLRSDLEIVTPFGRSILRAQQFNEVKVCAMSAKLTSVLVMKGAQSLAEALTVLFLCLPAFFQLNLGPR